MKVEPIRDLKDIDRITDMLKSECTDERGRQRLAMFIIGIEMGMRIGDMLHLRVGDLRGREWYSYMPEKTDTHISKKTGEQMPGFKPKEVKIPISSQVRWMVEALYRGKPDDAYIFATDRDARGRPSVHGHISRKTASRDMRYIAKRAGLPYNVGCHTLRKTFGYQYYRKHKDVAMLQEWFQHSSSATTLIYIGVADDEKRYAVEHSPYRGMTKAEWADIGRT